VNAIAGHDGFTLFDLVSYNDKHNDANGENNRDGALNEFSWNCGVEGASRKREIMRLRMKQMKNALAMVMLAQGTPMICAGDEMLNSQQGNTNPYCIDSEVSWVQWSGTKDAVSLHDYVKELIMFRRTHPLLHQKVELTGSSLGGFFPDFSCHGSNAWFASFDQQERSVGMMYCSQDPDREAVYQKETKLRKEARKLRKEPEDAGLSSGESYLYVAYNLHWEKRQLALPYLPSGREWHVVIDTSIDRFSKEEEKVCGCGQDEKEKCVDMPGRSIRVLVG
jgi:glycogen operon protein